MPTKTPRVTVVLEQPLYDVLRLLAERDRASVAAKVRDLVEQALEIEEDEALAALAKERERTLSRGNTLSGGQVWRRVGSKRNHPRR